MYMYTLYHTSAPVMKPHLGFSTSLLFITHANIHTELHLAALLGKTLLEKNAELEQKLRKLQDFAEEVVTDNEVIIMNM